MRTTVTTVCGVTCLFANSSPADCASRRPSELSRPKMSTTRRVATGAAARRRARPPAWLPPRPRRPGRRGAGDAVGMARNEVSFWRTPSSSTWTSLSCRSVTSLPFLSRTTRSSATTSAPDTKRGAVAGAWGAGGAWAKAKRRQKENTRDDRTRHLLRHAASWRPEQTPTLRIIAETRALDTPPFAPLSSAEAPGRVVPSAAAPRARARPRTAPSRQRGVEHDDRKDLDRPPAARLPLRRREPRLAPLRRRASGAPRRRRRRHNPSWAPGS